MLVPGAEPARPATGHVHPATTVSSRPTCGSRSIDPSTSTHQKSACSPSVNSIHARLDRTSSPPSSSSPSWSSVRPSKMGSGRRSSTSIRSSPGSGARGRPTSRPRRLPTRPASSSRVAHRRRRRRRARSSRGRTAVAASRPALRQSAGKRSWPVMTKPFSSRTMWGPSQSVRGEAPIKTNNQLDGTLSLSPRLRSARVSASRWPLHETPTTLLLVAHRDVDAEMTPLDQIGDMVFGQVEPRTTSTTCRRSGRDSKRPGLPSWQRRRRRPHHPRIGSPRRLRCRSRHHVRSARRARSPPAADTRRQ